MARNRLHLHLMISYEYNTPGYHKDNGVRMAVAKSELMSFTPTLAKIAVNAAKNAESNA